MVYSRHACITQDALNIYFKGRIHYLDCTPMITREIVHGKQNEAEWNRRFNGTN
jgi:hypothetical protein